MRTSKQQNESLESLINRLGKCTGLQASKPEALLTLVSLLSILSSQNDLLLSPALLRRRPRVNDLFHQNVSQAEHVAAALQHLANEGRKLLQNHLAELQQSGSGKTGTIKQTNTKI